MQRLRSRLVFVAAVGLVALPAARAGDEPRPSSPAAVADRSAGGPRAAAVPPPDEAVALALVQRHLPELASVLGPLQTANPGEYRKAIADLAVEARKLDDLRAKNPGRADLALEDLKARTRVELIAAQLASSPDPGKASELHRAIEARVDQTIRRHQFEVDQNEANVKRLRENLDRAEANRDKARTELQKAQAARDARIENRYQALIPKKKVPPTATRPKTKAAAPSATPPTSPAKSSRADRTTRVAGAIPPLAAAVPGHAVPMPTPHLPSDVVPLLAAPAPVAGETR